MTLEAFRQGSILDWVKERREKLRPKVSRIPWRENAEWIFADGVLKHKTNGFFKIVGAEIRHGVLLCCRPMIEQPEIGLLGFVVCETADGPYWLLQAKLEPGTVHFVQAAPSVQATESNYRRLHGGGETPFLDLFDVDQAPSLVDVRNSEQGSRFIDKFNRNAIRLVNATFDCMHPNWCWFDCEQLKSALRQDFLLNTDARSVIVCSPWHLLAADRMPFASREHRQSAGARDGIGEKLLSALRESYGTGSADIRSLLAALQESGRQNLISLTVRALEDLPSWQIGVDNIRCVEGRSDFEVVNYKVYAPEREVEHWAQPLFEGLEAQSCMLVCQQRSGRLKVFLRFSYEPGFGRRVEYGPSWHSGLAAEDWLNEQVLANGSTLLAVRQSDEGGRFSRVIVNYSLHYLSQDLATAAPESGVWVDLAELQTLCLTERTLTNEARSAISVLLSLV